MQNIAIVTARKLIHKRHCLLKLNTYFSSPNFFHAAHTTSKAAGANVGNESNEARGRPRSASCCRRTYKE